MNSSIELLKYAILLCIKNKSKEWQLTRFFEHWLSIRMKTYNKRTRYPLTWLLNIMPLFLRRCNLKCFFNYKRFIVSTSNFYDTLYIVLDAL